MSDKPTQTEIGQEAACQMLAALRQAYAVIDSMHQHDDVCRALNKAGLAGYAAAAAEKARTAIAKAERGA